MVKRIAVFDDHTKTEIPRIKEDDFTIIQLENLVWKAYLSASSQTKLEEVICEFLNGLLPEETYRRNRGYVKQLAAVTGSPSERRAQRARIKEFATHNFDELVAIGDRGRIHRDVLDKFYAEHPHEPKLFGD